MRTANDKQYLMVLGGPGVGKSTFLRKIGLEALKEEEGNFEHTCTPVFLELKRFTEDQINIESWITEEFKVCGYPYPEQMTNTALKSGELLILFDGLDEVSKPNVNNVFNKIRDFVDQYSENRFIVSCRPAAYTGGFTGFAVVEAAEFDDTQIQAYINNWFALGSNRKTETAQRCWEALDAPEHQAIRALAQNPLSLTLLCTIYEDSQSFPSNRTILYERILNIFLKKWTAEKHVHRDPPVSPYLDILTVKKMLSEIAAKNFNADCVLFSENELIDHIQEFYQRRIDTSSKFDASKILDAILIDPGLFVERVNGVYSFFHLTFQEYLTANYFVSTEPIQRLVAEHLHDERWREVFLFAAELLPEADSLLVAIEAEAAKSINTPGLKALFQWAKRITDTRDNSYSELTKRAFAIEEQYFSLQLPNTIEEDIKKRVKYALHFYRYLNLDHHRYLYRILNLSLHLELHLDIYQNIYQNIYEDLYRYVDPYFYRLFSVANRDQFDKELQERITFVERMEQMKILKGVDLQRMVQRFNAQREYIEAVGTGKSVEPPVESIHDTWLSVLGITDDMLAISRQEIENCMQYLRAVNLIVGCKEAAGRVSPEVWQEIEDRLLAWDSERFEG